MQKTFINPRDICRWALHRPRYTSLQQNAPESDHSAPVDLFHAPAALDRIFREPHGCAHVHGPCRNEVGSFPVIGPMSARWANQGDGFASLFAYAELNQAKLVYASHQGRAQSRVTSADSGDWGSGSSERPAFKRNNRRAQERLSLLSDYRNQGEGNSTKTSLVVGDRRACFR
jgi:hypothetical protein